MEEDKIDFSEIEKKWQERWEKNKAFVVSEKSGKKKFFNLEMFPYPSGFGLHMGHALNYTIGDIYARFKRMKGFNVLYPMGYDAFGLPAENAAIKAGEHPGKYTEKSMANFMSQQKALGLSYDWSRIVKTCAPEYYKWNQYFFLKFFENGLVERKKSSVNFCAKCNTVLANEQVHSGKCWRHEDTDVEIKQLEQWFIKTTKYSEELLGVSKLEWPERIKLMQENWIGKSEGVEIDFLINNEIWKIFTTRADTIFGVTFMVVSSQHPRLMALVTEKQKKEVEKFLKKLKSVSEKELEETEKEGVFTGSYAVNPITGEKVPVYAGNFVLADYGSGMVMAVPAHDSRDFEFAKKYKIPIKEVVILVDGEEHEKEEFRRTISAVVQRKSDKKFMLVRWKEFPWIAPVVGGIDGDESAGDAAVREVLEETGYKVRFVRNLGGEIESHFFADNKKVWRHRVDQPVLLELVDQKHGEVSAEENRKHEVIWLDESEAIRKITHKYNSVGILRYSGKEEAYTSYGRLVNSGEFSGLKSEEAIERIASYLEKKKLGRKTVNFKLRDWLVSRQRYWGTPIPIIYCDKCGIVPVPEKDLPVLLPDKVKFGKGNPLATAKSWLETKCPKCGKKARRETDTMDTFFDSSWYYLRYCDNENKKKPFNSRKIDYWMPVDQYIGGAEHACMHLIYARFFTKALRDLGFLKFSEPFTKLFNQGMLHGADGNKMSKSLGNVVNPIEMIEKYSADSLRLNLMSLASPDRDSVWNENGIESSLRFINKLVNYFSEFKPNKSSEKVESKINKAIKEVTEDIENFKYNLAVIKLRALFEVIEQEGISKNDSETFLKLISVFCPHIAEELWEKLGGKGFISLAEWPVADEKKINLKLEEEEKKVDRLISDILNIVKIISEREKKKVGKAYVYTIPPELKMYQENKGVISKKTGLEIFVFAVNDKSKIDPENKAGKAKPEKPAIYLE
ncbi:MAG: class I tRNA ligase family protein [Nanoarchaeota archaeon]|nr:class I tRNA ligase family protein [Nanoarchaeota archaeon]